MVKRCVNPACVNEFTPKNTRQRFCSKSCSVAVYRHSKTCTDGAARTDARYREHNTEKMKVITKEANKRNYLVGRLPPWMFT